MNIAAILTCFNRKEKTLVCLRSLFSIIPNIEVYLTDDGCTDGTFDIVNQLVKTHQRSNDVRILSHSKEECI